MEAVFSKAVIFNMSKRNQYRNIEEQTISACLIVKNEEKLLAQCLESIKDVVNEIIIVDTGSTDSTVDIAKSYTEKVYFHEWQNDFSEARNHSISFAQSDWIFIIDADEKLEIKDLPILRSVLRSDKFDSIFAAVLSDLPSGTSKHYSQRFFRRGKGHYEGIVHNQLVCEGNSLVTDIRVYHYGYNLDQDKMNKKFKRTESLLKNQISNNPNYMFAWMNLVRIYKCQELWDDAINTANEVITTKKDLLDTTNYQMIVYDMAYSLFSKKEYDKADKVCMDVLKSYPDNLDINFITGSINICKGNYEKAIRYYKRYLRISEEKSGITNYSNLIVDTYSSQGQAWNNIGSAYAELDRLDEATKSYNKAISYKKDPLYYENLARISLRQHKIDEMVRALEEADSLGIATGIMLAQLSDIYFRQNKIDKSIIYIKKAIELDQKNLIYQIKFAKLLVFNNNLEESQSMLQRVIDSGVVSPEILHDLAMISVKLNDREKADEYIDEISLMDDISSEQYLSMGDDWVSMKEHEIAIIFYEKCLQKDPKNSSALINISTCYAELGRYESAIIGYRAALIQNPNDPIITRNLIAMKKIIDADIRKSL